MTSISSSRARLTAGASGLALLLTLGLGVAGAAAEPAEDSDWHPPFDIVDHGIAAAEVNVRTGMTGTLPDGRDVVYMHSNGNPVSFTVVDLDTGEVIDNHLLDPKSIGGEIHALDDGSVYFTVRDGSGVILYYWDSATHELIEVEENPVGERLVRSLENDEDGVLYGVTYPNSKLFSYTPDTGEFRDYGSVVTDDSYAEGLAVHDGTAYVGTGMEIGHSIAVDLDSGEMTSLEVPAEYGGITRFYKYQLVGDLVAMAFSPGLSGGTNTLFWDTAAQDWVCDGAIPNTLSLNDPFTNPTADGRMFFKSRDEIWSFDSTDCSVEPTGWIDTDLADTGSHRILDLLATGTAQEPEYRLIGTNNDGSFWSFDPDSGEQTFVDGQIPGAPLTAHSIHVAADDRVYVGTYLGPGVLGRFDPQTQATEAINGPLQASSFLTFGDQMIIGSYGNAVVHMGDPHEEWDWDTNPSQQFRLSDGYEQDRLLGQATDGDLVAMASVSDYGVRGGALTLTDMADYRDTFRDLVQDQSHVSVTFGDDGLVYSGTSIRGGLSSPNSPLDAHLVVFDPETKEVVNAVIPVEGNDVVAGVTALGQSVWGVTNSGHLFEYDTIAGDVVEVHDLNTGASPSPWGVASTVQTHPENGLLYGIAGTAVFAFDPETGNAQTLRDDTVYKRMDIADDGTIYVIDETNLYSITVESGDGGGQPGAPVEQVQGMQADVADYIAAGDVAGPIAHQVTNALEQAHKHLEGGRTNPAIQALNRVVRHLENPKVQDTLTEQAQSDLLGQARAILDALA